MRVHDLRKLLEELPVKYDTHLIVMSSDAEGNKFAELAGYSVEEAVIEDPDFTPMGASAIFNANRRYDNEDYAADELEEIIYLWPDW